MTTKAAERIDEMRERINQLEAKAQTAGAEAKESMRGRIAALRQHEAAARTAVRERGDDADAKVEQLGTQVQAAEHGLAAELADETPKRPG